VLVLSSRYHSDILPLYNNCVKQNLDWGLSVRVDLGERLPDGRGFRGHRQECLCYRGDDRMVRGVQVPLTH